MASDQTLELGPTADWGELLAKFDEALGVLEGFDYEAAGLTPPAAIRLTQLRGLLRFAQIVRNGQVAGLTDEEIWQAFRAVLESSGVDRIDGGDPPVPRVFDQIGAPMEEN